MPLGRGGHAIRDKPSNQWVGFFSYIAGHCGLSRWRTSSMIIRAVAESPDGPYNKQMAPVIGPWSHNAMISQHPNGTFFLFHIGNGTRRGRPWAPVRPCSIDPDPFYPFPHEPAPSTTHAAENIFGPWRPALHVPAVNNPSVVFLANGTTLIFDRTSVRWAPSIDGPFTNRRTTVIAHGGMRPEDPVRHYPMHYLRAAIPVRSHDPYLIVARLSRSKRALSHAFLGEQRAPLLCIRPALWRPHLVKGRALLVPTDHPGLWPDCPL